MLSEYVHDSKGGAGEASRIEALAKVSRAYERQIKKGVLGGGKLVRLMLIQVPWLHTHIYTMATLMRLVTVDEYACRRIS